jgi:hypothetical protein
MRWPLCCNQCMTPRDLMLDQFWVGRRADAFDETCR